MIQFWFQDVKSAGDSNRGQLVAYYQNVETLMMIDLILIVIKSYYGIRCYVKGMGRRFFSQYFMWSGTYYMTNTIKYCMILISLSTGTGLLKSYPTYVFTAYNFLGCIIVLPTLNYTMQQLDSLHV